MENIGYVDVDRPEHITWPRLNCIFFGGGGASETPTYKEKQSGRTSWRQSY